MNSYNVCRWTIPALEQLSIKRIRFLPWIVVAVVVAVVAVVAAIDAVVVVVADADAC